MASEAQVLANRLNAGKSTGPRSPEGKAKISQNALKHGLRAQQAVIKGEDAAEFEFYREQMLGEMGPVGQMESVLAERVVSLSWRLRRAERLQNEAFDAFLTPDMSSPFVRHVESPRATMASESGTDDGLALCRAVVKDFSNTGSSTAC